MRTAPWVLITMLATAQFTHAHADSIGGDGLRVSARAESWPRWQGRLALGTDDSPGYWRKDAMAGSGGTTYLTALSLLGDYYFATSPRASGQVGGFRATSGLMTGLSASTMPWSLPGQTPTAGRNGLAVPFNVQTHALATGLAGATGLGVDAAEPRVLPYLGVGYTGLSNQGGWGFSADIGLVARHPGQAVRLGRVFSGTQSVDDLLRDLRLSPLLQLGVSYSF